MFSIGTVNVGDDTMKHPIHESKTIDVSIYDDHVPNFVERHLELLYQNIFTTVARFDIYNAAKNASTYVVRKGGQVSTVFLFRREGDQVTVYNQQIKIDGHEIKQFSDLIFSKYKSVSLISFYAIETDIKALPYPFQKLNCLEDISLILPDTADEYFRNLSKSTRAAIKKNQRKMSQHFPSFRFDTYSKDEVSENQIRDIVALSRARMSGKNKRFHYNEDAIQQLIRLVRKYGTVLIATTESGICAGTICHHVGENFFMHVLAHDPNYNAYGLGKLCCYQSICAAIEQSAKEYHFGWGRNNYKYNMGGVNNDLYRVEIYRSLYRLTQNMRHFLEAEAFAEIRRYKLWIERVDQGNTDMDARIVSTIMMLRRVKTFFRKTDRNKNP